MAGANDAKAARMLHTVRDALVVRLPEYDIEVRDHVHDSVMRNCVYVKYIDVQRNDNSVCTIDYGDWDEDYFEVGVVHWLMIGARVKVGSDLVLDMSAPGWMDRLVATIEARTLDGR